MDRAGRTDLPVIVAHADWSAGAAKRWLARAIWQGGYYLACEPEPVSEPAGLLAGLLKQRPSQGAVLAGFDFPIGLPRRYAHAAGIEDFLTWLQGVGHGEWADFFSVASSPTQINLHQPFYPLKPGNTSRQHLLDGLGLKTLDDLLRQCDRSHAGRRAACPLFWTLGGQQVGKAAISGWQAILLSAGLDAELAIWPFAGELKRLFQPGGVVVCETYPAEYYCSLGVCFSPPRRGRRSGKRVQSERAANAQALLDWAARAGLSLTAGLEQALQNGFGPQARGEDQFDAVVGLFGMLAVVLGNQPPGEPYDEVVRRVEGWIIGQKQPRLE
jgi:hypothetical protein